MPTPRLSAETLVQRLECQVTDLTGVLQETLRLLHMAAVSRHYEFHEGYFTECPRSECQQIRERLQRFCPPGAPPANNGVAS